MGGTVFSGVKGWRGGKPPTDSLPVARLIYAELFSVQKSTRPKVIPDNDDWATVKFGELEWCVFLDNVPLPFGGHRRFMLCPVCTSKRSALYVYGKVLACRVCLGLRFRSQHETKRDRMFSRLYAIREQLGWQGGLDQPNGKRPYRMHLATFKRLEAKHDALADALLGNLSDWIKRANGVTPIL